jgi:DNA topoisomerase-1
LETAEQAPAVVQETGEVCPESGHPLIRRFGRFGPFLACSGFPECRYTRPDGDAEPQASDEKCDVCGSAMVVKRGRFGAFLACTRYPECKGTKPLLQKTGIPCPLDGGEIVERQTKKGRKFYGCSNYPKCEFTSWQRPMQQVCPQCGGLIVAERGRRAKCTVCDWSGPASQARERSGGAAKAPAGVS